MNYNTLCFLLYHFSLFRYNPDTNPRLTIVSYPELEDDYVQFLTEFTNQPMPKLGADNSSSQSLKENLQNFCQNLLQSRLFELIRPSDTDSKLRRIRSTKENMPTLWEVGFEAIRVKIKQFADVIPMFPCYKGVGSEYYLVTYGFSPGYMFLFKQQDRDSSPEIYGLVEPTPVINGLFRNKRHLEKYFVQIHRALPAKSRKLDPLCSLNGYQQFRLCSVLENVRRYAEKEDALDRIVNTEKKHQQRCEVNREVSFATLDKVNFLHATLTIRITGVPCFTDKGRFTFLVSHDPTDEYSVFILEQHLDHDSNKKEMFVVQHVRDVALLKYADKFY